MLAYENLVQARQPLVRVVHEEGEGQLLHLSFGTNYLREKNTGYLYLYPSYLLSLRQISLKKIQIYFYRHHNSHQVRAAGFDMGEKGPVEGLQLSGQGLQALGQHREAEVVCPGHTLHLGQELVPDRGKLLAEQGSPAGRNKGDLLYHLLRWRCW